MIKNGKGSDKEGREGKEDKDAHRSGPKEPKKEVSKVQFWVLAGRVEASHVRGGDQEINEGFD